MIYVTGDIHGGLDISSIAEWEEGKTLNHDDYLIIAGDFGIPWDFSTEEDNLMWWIESRPWTTLFIDGNHERFDYWKNQPVEEWNGGRTQKLHEHSRIRRLMRGEMFNIGGTSLFTMGGATSVDKAFRTEGKSWWPDELPSESEINHARETLDSAEWEVDYVITHTCASSLLAKTLYPKHDWEKPDTDRLTNFFNELEYKLVFKRWYYGHFHIDRDIDHRHTTLLDAIVPLGEGIPVGYSLGL